MTGKPSKLPLLLGSRGNSVRRVALPLIALVALFLGVVNASGHATATRTITVEVLGKGSVASRTSTGSTAVTATPDVRRQASQTRRPVTLTRRSRTETSPTAPGASAAARHPRHHLRLCSPGRGRSSARATFNPKAGTTQSTLSVDLRGDGSALTTGRPRAASRSTSDCGNPSDRARTCTWVVPSGSTLTVFQTPDWGNIFLGLGRPMQRQSRFVHRPTRHSEPPGRGRLGARCGFDRRS